MYATVFFIPVLFPSYWPTVWVIAITMPDESEDSIALWCVPLSQDNESDKLDYQKDIDIIKHLQSNIGELDNKWMALLVLITADNRLKKLDLRDTEAFLKDHPVVKRVLQFG
jgi:hypothetical protein